MHFLPNRLMILGVALALAACGAEPAALEACDPFAAEPQPLALGTILAAGEDAAGVLYVVEQPAAQGDGKLRVFVSEGDALYRKRVLGSGVQGGGDFTVSFEDGSTPSRLVFQRSAGAVTGMALVHDRDRSFLDALGPEAERLTLVKEAEVRDRALHNLPGEIVLEHLGSVDDGNGMHTIVVTRPRDDWSYEDFRLFYGAEGQLTEREVENVSRGNATFIEFDVDGATYLVVFGSPLGPSESTLRVGSVEYQVQAEWGATSVPAGTSFECRR
jgi:hypothetical protein